MIMYSGVDLASDLSTYIPAIKEAGYRFAGRYYISNASTETWKQLTRPEAEALSAAGIALVAVFEFRTDDGYFSEAQGKTDAATALAYAIDTIGQPAGSAIYFAVDSDPAPQVVTENILPYFQGIQATFDSNLANAKYKVGVYGSGYVCSTMLENGLAEFAWLSGSASFLGSETFTRFNLKQGADPVTLTAGDQTVQVDTDSCPDLGNIGSFLLPNA